MATIQSKKIINEILRNNGRYADDPQCTSVWKYVGVEGQELYAVFYDERTNDIMQSGYVQEPKLLFNVERGLTAEGRELIGLPQGKENFVVNVLLEIPLSRVADLLAGAFEGGSNYWYEIEEFKEPSNYAFRTSPGQIYRHIDYPLNDDGYLKVRVMESEEWPVPDVPEIAQHKIVDLNSIEVGLEVMAAKHKRHFSDFLAENDDAETADVFLQCVVFGEVYFG